MKEKKKDHGNKSRKKGQEKELGYITGGGLRALPHNLAVDIKRNKVLYVILVIILAYFAVFNYAPMVGLLMAFQKYQPVKGLFGSKWIGLTNFEQFFSGPFSCGFFGIRW